MLHIHQFKQFRPKMKFLTLSSNTPSLKVLRGSDVSLRCDVPLLNESSTLLWEKDGEQISNNTLIFNNSAFIILYTVDEHSEGKYYCKLMEDGKTETVRIHTLNVTLHSYNGEKRNRLIYRQSSSNSDVLLICKSSKTYESLKWTWEPKPNSRIDLIAFEKEIQVQLKEPNKRSGIRSSTKYNSQALIFHISPVYFNYRGTYRCITEISVYTTIILHTIRVAQHVSAEDTMTQDSHLHIVITVACAVSVSVLILLGLLVFKYQRKTDSYNGEKKNRLIYRQSSSNSDVLLIFKSSKNYKSLKWTWEPKPNSRIDLIAFENEIQVQLKEPIKPGIRSSTKYNSQALIFHISPVYFNYRGTYRCITEISVYTTIILHTIRGLQKVNE
ncbi:hypothetical protein cypCar_00020584 [Cyprinus carpio]|nr:hypothetical protein cypCar_00020584 [Cyprinus carpio]